MPNVLADCEGNITSGNIHPLQSQLARIDGNIAALRPFEEWLAVARPDQLDAATSIKGSPAKFYLHFADTLLRLREKIEAQLLAVNVQRGVAQ